MEPIFLIYSNGVLMAELSESEYSMKEARKYAIANFNGRIDVVPHLR